MWSSLLTLEICCSWCKINNTLVCFGFHKVLSSLNDPGTNNPVSKGRTVSDSTTNGSTANGTALNSPVTKLLLLSPVDTHLRKEAISLGVTDVRYKPIKPTELRESFISLLTNSVQHRSLQQKPNHRNLAKEYPRKILLVEDNLVNQKVALRMLAHLRYEVDLACNGLEAIEAMHRQQYDLLLMDVQMPEMNGLDATRNIRQMPLSAQPQIIAMSAAAMIDDQKAAQQAGMDGYIIKPVSLDELARVIQTA